ncbi:methylated-DNA--[protein]-cysteine S-methyltransferase [Phytohabitans rumicis]|uniref:Methylated-DNA--protein-cysteine methyltransferase n=1 Tax=Phytohabitans rumicis TaxID=1076125 RepID=A0A6V8LDJ8_9ACTN|nr:methylated-DNA--[protein]-cysteine S-methyltransferase [Phytohabitans rumicis]GFJ94394.1 methylated-DNA--protein-cysteine methyltransferase [Phytohabitans rumicis]
MATVYATFDSPLGDLLLVGSAGPGGPALTRLAVDARPQPEWRRDQDAFADAGHQLRAYFAGERRAFDLPYAASGTAFQRRVWLAVDAIPYGRTATYGALAERVGAPRDRIRAVAAAVGANPLLILRPCHRVVGADGKLTGYAAGLERKRYLLNLEGGTMLGSMGVELFLTSNP